MSSSVRPSLRRASTSLASVLRLQSWAPLLRRLGQRLCLALLVLGLPVQGMASVIGHIDRAAHVHRPAAPRLADALALRVTDRPDPSSPVALPPGMPVLLSVDELRHSHGAPMRPRSPAAARHHAHAGVGHHRHAADDASVIAVADPADDVTGQGSTKRVLLDLDTPPSVGAALRAGMAAARPQQRAAAGLPEPRPDRLERPPRSNAA